MIKYNRIKDLREDHDYKQEEIAKYLEVERSVYAKWENGDRNIPLSKVDSLSVMYNVPLSYILGQTTKYEKDIDKSIFKYKFTGNGYDFENLFRSYVENKLPKLSNELRYDSEAGMFSAFSDSEKPLEKIAYCFNNDLKNNKDFITSLVLNMTDYEVQL